LSNGNLLLFFSQCSRLRLKCDGTRAETRFSLSVKWTSPFKSAGASVQPTTGSRSVRISGSNAGYTMFCGSVKSTGNPLHSPVSPSLPLPCVTVCHHISSGLYSCYIQYNECGQPYCLITLYQQQVRNVISYRNLSEGILNTSDTSCNFPWEIF